MVWNCLWIGVAGFLGAIARYLISVLCRENIRTDFPLPTLIINVSGSLLLGWVLAMGESRWPMSATTRLAIATGFVGAYTTFSTFAYETNELGRQSWTKAMIYVVLSVVLGLIAVKLGLRLGATKMP